MTTLKAGRRTVTPDQDVVVFHIGMRINRLANVRRWAPVLVAMPRMLRELANHPELGLLHAETYWSGRTLMVVQYWRSFDHLSAYAKAADQLHLPAWRAFNRAARSSDATGVFHETYVVPASAMEAISVDLPPRGLLRALGSTLVERRGQSADHRLDPARPDRATAEA